VTDETLEATLADAFMARGASGYTAISCRGAGRTTFESGSASRNDRLENGFAPVPNPQVQMEVVAPGDVCERILEYLRREILPDYRVTAYLETVEVARPEKFTGIYAPGRELAGTRS
jgi:hypothetical protein